MPSLLVTCYMPCSVDTPGRPAPFLKGNRRNGSGRDRRCWGGVVGKSVGKGNCSWDEIYEKE